MRQCHTCQFARSEVRCQVPDASARAAVPRGSFVVPPSLPSCSPGRLSFFSTRAFGLPVAPAPGYCSHLLCCSLLPFSVSLLHPTARRVLPPAFPLYRHHHLLPPSNRRSFLSLACILLSAFPILAWLHVPGPYLTYTTSSWRPPAAAAFVGATICQHHLFTDFRHLQAHLIPFDSLHHSTLDIILSCGVH